MMHPCDVKERQKSINELSLTCITDGAATVTREPAVIIERQGGGIPHDHSHHRPYQK